DLAAENELLNLPLDLIIELIAVVAEKLNAVVGVRIMRSGEDDSRIGAQGASDVSDTGSGQRADHKHIHSKRRDTGDQRIFAHVTGEPGVFAEHNLRLRPARMRPRIQ